MSPNPLRQQILAERVAASVDFRHETASDALRPMGDISIALANLEKEIHTLSEAWATLHGRIDSVLALEAQIPNRLDEAYAPASEAPSTQAPLARTIRHFCERLYLVRTAMATVTERVEL